MKKIHQELLFELHKNGLTNPLLSPIWLLKYENIYHKGTFYLKVYLLENTDITKLNEVQFEIRNEDLNFLVNVDTFNQAESYKNDSVLGCLIKLPHELENKDFELLIRRLVINNKVIQFNESDFSVYRLNESQTEILKNKYISKVLKNYTFLPSHIENNMWICSCGKVNSGTKCENCNSSLEDINKLIDKNLDNLFIQTYSEKNPFNSNPKIDVNSNLKNHFNPLIEYGYTVDDANLFGLSLEQIKNDADLYKKKSKKNTLLLSILSGLIIVFILGFIYFDKQSISDDDAVRIWGNYTKLYSNRYLTNINVEISLNIKYKYAWVCIDEYSNSCKPEKVVLNVIKSNRIDFEYKGEKLSIRQKDANFVKIEIDGTEILLAKR